MYALPTFLEPMEASPPHLPYRNAIFRHKGFLGSAHALWWSHKSNDTPPRVVIDASSVVGNPGLLDFYTPFLSTLHDKDSTAKLAIFAHSHIGHTPGVQNANFSHSTSSHGLTTQVQSAIEAFDAIKTAFGAHTKVVIVGHSVGAWISLQVLQARPEAVSAVFLLFPTISQIALTPNGRRLSWLFHAPVARILSSLSYFTRLFPLSLLSILFHSWPLPQILVLRKLLHSPATIYATLVMAADEMKTIRDLDTTLLNEHKHRLWMYFAEEDEWVGEQKAVVLRSFEADPETIRVVHGHHDIPHAFCINHGEQLGTQCHQWLSTGFV